MRPWHGLLLAVLLTPTVQAEPDPIAIHLEGEQGVHLTLHWTIDTGPLERLDLYRFVDGAMDVIPLDPTSDQYTEGRMEANVTAYWMGGVTVDGERVWSNVYDGHCPWLEPKVSVPPLHVEPRCIRNLPVVPESTQARVKEELAKLFSVV